MTWQDALRRLDDEMTTGRISVEEYLRCRDALIATTGTEQDAVPTDRQPASAQRNPFPPPFRWDTTPTNATTDVFEPVRIDDEIDPSEPTQIVANAPPWPAADLPPTRHPVARTQDPNFFLTDDNQAGFARIIAVAAVIVMLTGIGITSYFLFTPAGSDPALPATPMTAPLAPGSFQPPMAELPGERVDTSMVRSLSRFALLPQDLNPLTDTEREVLSEAEAGEVAFALSRDGDTTIGIVVVPVRNADDVRDELADLQVDLRLRELRGLRWLRPEVRAAADDRVPGEHPVLRRAHYASGEYLIRIDVSGVGAAKADRLFQEVVTAQLEKLPPAA